MSPEISGDILESVRMVLTRPGSSDPRRVLSSAKAAASQSALNRCVLYLTVQPGSAIVPNGTY